MLIKINVLVIYICQLVYLLVYAYYSTVTYIVYDNVLIDIELLKYAVIISCKQQRVVCNA